MPLRFAQRVERLSRYSPAVSAPVVRGSLYLPLIHRRRIPATKPISC